MRAPDELVYNVHSLPKWQEIEALLGQLGVDANTVMIDAPLLMNGFAMKPKRRSLRETLKQLHYPRTKYPTSLQSAKGLRKLLCEIEGVLAGLDAASTGALYFFNFKELTAAKQSLTILADKVRLHITIMEADGGRSQHNASKRARNIFWCDLADLWVAATVNATKKPARRHLFKFITLIAPAVYSPNSLREVDAGLDRFHQTSI